MFDSIRTAQSIRSRLEDSSARSERLRRLDDDAAAALREAGLVRIFTFRAGAPLHRSGSGLPSFETDRPRDRGTAQAPQLFEIPKRYGGHELPPRAQILACVELARGCPFASWALMAYGAHGYVVGRFAERCQEEVFGSDPDILIAGTLATQVTIEPASQNRRATPMRRAL